MKGSPLAEGRELKYESVLEHVSFTLSPLAEGRELKYEESMYAGLPGTSPLAEGRELKYDCGDMPNANHGRPSRRGVN